MGDDGKVDINMAKPAPDDDDLWFLIVNKTICLFLFHLVNPILVSNQDREKCRELKSRVWLLSFLKRKEEFMNNLNIIICISMNIYFSLFWIIC